MGEAKWRRDAAETGYAVYCLIPQSSGGFDEAVYPATSSPLNNPASGKEPQPSIAEAGTRSGSLTAQSPCGSIRRPS
jgi:hypothetical protein